MHVGMPVLPQAPGAPPAPSGALGVAAALISHVLGAGAAAIALPACLTATSGGRS